jgi:hypothetical protein
MRTVRVALLAATSLGLVSLIQARPADACSCGDLGFTAPAVGTAGVPTNTTQIFLAASEVVPGASDVELVQGTTQTVVALTFVEDDSVNTVGTRYTLGAALDPSAPYYLRETGTAGPGVELFTTAAAADTTPPAAPTIANLAVTRTVYDPTDCGSSAITNIDGVVNAPDAVVLGMRVELAGATTTYYLPAATDPFEYLPRCNSVFSLPGDADVTFAFWSEDAAGNRSVEVSLQARVVEIDMTTPPLDDGGCSTGGGGASLGGALGLLALRRRRRC